VPEALAASADSLTPEALPSIDGMGANPIPELEAANAILDLVRTTEVGGDRSDMAATAMFGAYLRAYRRLVCIRDLARKALGARPSSSPAHC
jgi:hypothetical protein